MNLLEKSEQVMVEEHKKSFSFNCVSLDGTKYSTSIYSMSPNIFSCVRTEERVPISTDEGYIFQKNVVENVVSIDELGGIVIDYNSSTVNNFRCENWNCNEISFAERKTYTSDGVMSKKEIKTFPQINIKSGINSINESSMLIRARQGFEAGNFTDSYDTRTFLVRDQFDTAKVKFEDKSKGMYYFSVLPLDQRYGLRDMNLIDNAIFSPEVEILPTSKYDVEQVIKRESNEKVADGLRKIAIGRENYYYNSADDFNFVCIVSSEEKGISM